MPRYSYFTSVNNDLIHAEVTPRASVDDSMLTRRAREASKSSKRNSGVELVIPKFTFVPFNRTYTYATGTVPSRTIVVAEVNLPAGVRPEMCELSIGAGGEVLELVCEWPSYMLNPREFNGKWLEGTGDGTLRATESRITSAQQACQETIREFGSRKVKSTARIILPCSVTEDMDKVQTYRLGFEDVVAKEGELRSNGCALQVHMLAIEEFPPDLFAVNTEVQFEKVKRPTTIATRAPGTGLTEI